MRHPAFTPSKEVMNPRALTPTLRRLDGLLCWYVNAGGAAGTSFSLALGEKVLRDKPLNNPGVNDDFRIYEGEFNLYVWCSWRLEQESCALSSSNQDPAQAADALKELTGSRLSSIEVDETTTDLKLLFGNRVLRVFCDHCFPDPSCSANWELFWAQRVLAAGPGFVWCEEET